MLAAVAATLPCSNRAAVTMTAELCDCYPTKTVGVNAVLDAVARRAFPAGRSWSGELMASFTRWPTSGARPQLAAAANWLALATLAARLIPESSGSLDRHRNDHDGPDPARPRDEWRRGGGATPSGSRPASWSMRASAARRSAPWRPSCRSRGIPNRFGRRDLRLDAGRLPDAG